MSSRPELRDPTCTSLLAQDWSATAFQAASTAAISQALASGQPIALLGAGQTGRQVAALLGTAVRCFLDDTPGKQGSTVMGIPVHGVDAGLRTLGARPLVVVCIFSARHSLAHTRARLLKNRDCTVCSFAQVLHARGGGLPNLYLGDITHQVAQQSRYRRLAARLADARSVAVLEQHLCMRLRADFSALPDARDELDFLGIADDEQPSFVDGGAFDGDTLRDFLSWRQGRFARVIAYEPDEHNFQRLCATVHARPPHERERISLRQAALWSHRSRVGFDSTGQVGSAIGESCQAMVDTEGLASLPELPGPLLVKLDVEGAEGAVLRGASSWIRQHRPMLGISVYHRPDDLLDLFELIEAQHLPYRYHLRCHGGDGTDLMLYCVDSSRPAIAAATSPATDASM